MKIFCKYPFTRAELALAAGAYQGLLIPTVPDDTTAPLLITYHPLVLRCSPKLRLPHPFVRPSEMELCLPFLAVSRGRKMGGLISTCRKVGIKKAVTGMTSVPKLPSLAKMAVFGVETVSHLEE